MHGPRRGHGAHDIQFSFRSSRGTPGISCGSGMPSEVHMLIPAQPCVPFDEAYPRGARAYVPPCAAETWHVALPFRRRQI